MSDFVTDSSIKVTGAHKERHALILSVSSALLFCARCKQVCISRPHINRNCCLSESWTDVRSDSFRKECVWLGGNLRTNKLCQHSVCSLESISIHVCVATVPLQPRHLAHILLPPSLYLPSHHRFLSFPSFTSSLFNQACIHPPCRHFHPHCSLSELEPRQAGFTAGGPDGAQASQPALGL